MYKDRSRALKGLKCIAGFRVPMAGYTTMRVGGPCAALCRPGSLEELVEFVKLCRRRGISYLAIGNGSNIIVADKGMNKVLLRLSSPFFKRIDSDGESLMCGAGLGLNMLCHAAERLSLGGPEFLVGIPGSVGGAIVQNAGAYGGSISDIIKEIMAVDRDGRVRVLKAKSAGLGYRKSSLAGLIIVKATFCLKKRSRTDIRDRLNTYTERRLSTQDYSAPSCGCMFKNPRNAGLTAAKMIDRCGLKGTRVGGASVSSKHANFIINRRHAKAADILRLIALVKKRVNKDYGVKLEEEVQIIR
ncbi:MAG: UDP-N-acetylmuramate dehydrogenase [Candidatus Omnitrophica bacterium]|nr:UDP-N-acetylmuramate dehydrogenase [Candidatus Omnitrophota bacterium]